MKVNRTVHLVELRAGARVDVFVADGGFFALRESVIHDVCQEQ